MEHSTPFNFTDTKLITSGAMSFNPQVHGTPIMGSRSMNDNSFSFNPSQFSDVSEATASKIAALQVKLNQKLGPEYISQRPGPGGGPKLTYAEGWKIINLANEVFGFNGWSSSIVSLNTDFVDYNEESKRYNVGVTAVVRVTLRDGVYHEDLGYGLLENSKSKGAAFDKCKKEAVTDGLKRALRNFGNLLGNCLYDKSYTQEVVKIKVQQPKFDQSSLYRRPEFDQNRPNAASTSSSASNSTLVKGVNDSVVAPTHQNAIPSGLSGPKDTAGLPHTAKPSSKAERLSAINSSMHQSALERTSSTITLSNQTKAEPSRKMVNASSDTMTTPQFQPGSSTEYHDENFPFCSDDDALLALVDLGEGDLGQPVLPETDLGRPIDDEEGEADLSWGVNSPRGNETVLPKDKLPYVAPSTTRPQGSALQQEPPSVRSLSRSTSQYQLQPQHIQRPPQQPASMSRPVPPQTANQVQQHQKAQHQTYHPNAQNKPLSAPARNNENQFQQRPQGNSHQHPIQRTPSMTSTSAATGKRPSTPSVGGFRFPPGMDPLDPSRSASRSHPHDASIGVKRPLESMSKPVNTGLGIGLNNGVGAVQVKREVFGELEFDKGGEVKRMRR